MGDGVPHESIGEGPNKKEARTNAAKLMYARCIGVDVRELDDEVLASEQGETIHQILSVNVPKSESIGGRTNAPPRKEPIVNYVGQLFEFSKRHGVEESLHFEFAGDNF